jgi:hypothetical protein
VVKTGNVTININLFIRKNVYIRREKLVRSPLIIMRPSENIIQQLQLTTRKRIPIIFVSIILFIILNCFITLARGRSMPREIHHSFANRQAIWLLFPGTKIQKSINYFETKSYSSLVQITDDRVVKPFVPVMFLWHWNVIG